MRREDGGGREEKEYGIPWVKETGQRRWVKEGGVRKMGGMGGVGPTVLECFSQYWIILIPHCTGICRRPRAVVNNAKSLL